MWKAVTFVSAVATMAMLALLIFLVEKADTGAEWTLLAMWFGLCDRLLPNSRLASADKFTSATMSSSRADALPEVREQEAAMNRFQASRQG
jgi:hypothetical protein